jgi:hypothetical protein
LREPGEFTFYRNLEDDVWSSFDPEKGKKGGRYESTTVPCITAQQLIASHGRPFFMKVDIEGADYQVLESLDAKSVPDYISLELSCVDPILERLLDLGYSRFKLVDGESYRPAPPIFNSEIGWRMLRKMGRLVPPIRKTICMLPERLRGKSEFNPPGKYSPDGYPFTRYSSGPFGEQAAGPWLGADDALRIFGRLRDGHRKANRHLWWDVQARHSSVPGCA